MQTAWTLTDDQGREIAVRVSFESNGREVQWIAQFSGTTHATGELSGTAKDEADVRGAVQAALLQAGVLTEGKSR
ncbi:hypothetical protein [Luteibacter sp.]|uniref:hypothetical protein n=1 Tax=Luteibacter sp. TaxID=1886636 RepID=UPI003F7D5F7B